MEDKDIEFSIVSSNEDMLTRCVQSLRETMKPSAYKWSITVTTDSLGPGVGGRIKARYPDVGVLDNRDAASPAASHNRILRVSRARYVWLLSDKLLILPNAVRLVTEFMDKPQSSRVGLVSPRLLGPDGSVQPLDSVFPSMSQLLVEHSGFSNLSFLRAEKGDALPGNAVTEVDTLPGACVAVRTKAVRQVGPMIEDGNAEDVESEWHRRFKEHAWKVVYFSPASAIHYGSPSSRGGSRSRYPEYLRGALYFFRTGRGPASYSLFCASMATIFGVKTAVAAFRRDIAARNAASSLAAVAWSGLLRRS